MCYYSLTATRNYHNFPSLVASSLLHVETIGGIDDGIGWVMGGDEYTNMSFEDLAQFIPFELHKNNLFFVDTRVLKQKQASPSEVRVAPNWLAFVACAEKIYGMGEVMWYRFHPRPVLSWKEQFPSTAIGSGTTWWE